MTKQKIQTTGHFSTTQAYQEGCAAYNKGYLPSECPYRPSGPISLEPGFNSQRYKWYMGYYDTKYRVEHNIIPTYISV